ncbi:vitamin B12-dependent ribonucleotide reductase [Rhodothermus bifroesti]|uniref:Vitamin B12-dependent ribonucleotide reductase n=1 Tax=Rhodothermus marinus TaxID=29549 RepID=A0A7V2B1P9_RHOMR|nr:vitamin B12-dependent ribonucleotide reductase [Rhodothermus bifroesti]
MAKSPRLLPEASTLRQGLRIARVFSTEGQHPFDSVVWERRTAAIYNSKGEAVFEQKDVEFPSTWSQLATNVVASKYFYGDLAVGNGDPREGKREYSLKQLIHRVTRTITDWGRDQGYFASPEDAERFYDELTWLCLHQYGAFNSPVWFNVGLYHLYGVRDTGGKTIWGWDFKAQRALPVDPYERPQASACFIISVEDSIDDIWQLMAESARLFKFGSGVGADWSKLRSTKEKLSGGGQPSGPVSFMRVQDATGATIKSGGKTRRAAIMQTLKVWHPDIMEFVTAKAKEEKKAWALIEQGYDGSFNGEAYNSVAFQNVNQSVRVTDEFMEAVLARKKYPLRAVTTGQVVEEIDAYELLYKVAEGTWICGDPGLQYEDTIQKWHTCKNSGPINSSNPCSEYMFLDNSACNLASLNLRKFQREDGSFDVERFRAAVRIFITAMEILVDNAGYPSEKIAQNSHDYRPLGLGFANLGAMLMAMGLPYDSDEGRAVAGAITAIMHAEAYARSAEIAAIERIGPFAAFEQNRDCMLEVMRMHQAAVEEIHPSCPAYLKAAARESMARMVALGERYGYRNAQATVLAPTGTISFMMDCDTTGIEPDIALVKYKLLAGKGDGMLKIVNNTVPIALRRLGYTEEQIRDILAYIEENDTIEGAPHLQEAHLSVFDCAFKPYKGQRFIHYMGHIKMMAACQPFISGAISKTVNMPEHVTVEEIMDAYIQGWKLGLKALAIYRENSKRSQPLSTRKEDKKAESSGDGVAASEPQVIEKVIYKPVRKRLPDERPSLTHKFSVAGHEGYLHIGLYPDTAMPGEIFITMAKQGSTISGLMDAFATAISIALQYGVPLEDLCNKFSHMRFEPSGFTNNPQIPIAKSIMDYIFRYLSLKFLGRPQEEKSETPGEGVAAEVKRSGPARDERQLELSFETQPTGPITPLVGPTIEAFLGLQGQAASGSTKTTPQARVFEHQEDAPACSNCGSITVRSGACYVCPNCGNSSGCG